MRTVRCGFDGIPTVLFGAVLRTRQSYGPVRCGFRYWKSYVRFGAVFRCREPYGAVRLYFVLRYGSVWFSDIVKPMVRCGAVFKRGKILRRGAVNRTEPHRTDRTNRTVKNPAYLHATGTCVFTVWAGIGERVSLQVAKKNRHQSFTTFNLSEWASNINSILHIFTGITQTTVYNTQEKGWF